MHRKYHEKFKILDILAVTTQAHEGIEIEVHYVFVAKYIVTTQAHEGIEMVIPNRKEAIRYVTTQAHEGIEIVEHTFFSYSFTR